MQEFTLTLGSLFDGIGGFPLAGLLNGITPVWASEIEAFPISVTKKRFPEMLHVGDITKLNGAELPPVDIITGGSPCQDLSVAGARKGLMGERSGLFMEQIRIIKEMRWADEQRGRTNYAIRPRFMCWENVPGAFSSGISHGEDFRIVIEETARIADSELSVPRLSRGLSWTPSGAVVGSQFSIAWRVFDTQYWPGTPQRRRRIFLVADFGGHSASKILFEQNRLFGNSAESQNPWQGTATATQDSAGDAGRNEGCLMPWDNQSKRIFDSSGIWHTLYAGNGGGNEYIAEERKEPIAFSCNQRDEVRNLNNVAGALQAQPGMKQQTFVAVPQENIQSSDGCDCDDGQAGECTCATITVGFNANAASKARGIGYQEECAPTLKGSSSGTVMLPSVICLNDQGGQRMDIYENITGTLRAQMDGHPPLVLSESRDSDTGNARLYDNHAKDSRYIGPLDIAPTMTARYGTVGNNIPLVTQEQNDETYCIVGNIIGREDKNGGNGFGYQHEISYTLTATDRHAVYNRSQSVFTLNEVTGTQCARQYKDATDLVVDIAGLDCRSADENGDLCGTLQSASCSLNNVHPVRIGKLIRRLTPKECERLQGFPDGWTDIGGSDSARYKALGNAVAIPCVRYVLQGIAFVLLEQKHMELDDVT